MTSKLESLIAKEGGQKRTALIAKGKGWGYCRLDSCYREGIKCIPLKTTT